MFKYHSRKKVPKTIILFFCFSIVFATMPSSFFGSMNHVWAESDDPTEEVTEDDSYSSEDENAEEIPEDNFDSPEDKDVEGTVENEAETENSEGETVDEVGTENEEEVNDELIDEEIETAEAEKETDERENDQSNEPQENAEADGENEAPVEITEETNGTEMKTMLSNVETMAVTTITTAAELDNIRNDLTGDYVLGADIDLSGYPDWDPIGNNSSTYFRFKGTFDGNGHKITGLTINKPTENYVGLFGFVDQGEIKNVQLKDVNVTGNSDVGGVAGRIDRSTMENSSVSGNVTGNDNMVGGLIGHLTRSDLISSFAKVTVTGKNDIGGLVGYVSGSSGNQSSIIESYSTGDVVGEKNVGGLVGRVIDGLVRKSYATGNVTGNHNNLGGLIGSINGGEVNEGYATGSVTGSSTSAYVGGLIGSPNSMVTTIENTFATGGVEGNHYVGGLIGKNQGSTINVKNSYATGSVTGSGGGLIGNNSGNNYGTIENNFYDTFTTGKSDTGKGVPKSSSEMIDENTFTGWDFTSIWGINPGEYPHLLFSPYSATPPVVISDIIYVDTTKTSGNNDGTSWNDAYTSLQEALDTAKSNSDVEEIWLAEGTYYPTKAINQNNDRTKSFQMINGVTIYGGFPTTGNPGMADRDPSVNETMLSGDLNANGTLDDDDAYHVFYHHSLLLDETAILDGVTVLGGNANGSGYHGSGGGMFNWGSSPLLKDVIVRNNGAVRGGGINNSSDSDMKLIDVTIRENNAYVGSGLNAASGGGMSNLSSSPKLTNVTITNNSATRNGGGIFNLANEPILTDVMISENNAAEGGGMYNKNGNPTLNNVNINVNTAEYGGGISNDRSAPIFIGGSIINNEADFNGGGVYNRSSSNPTFTDTIISHNTAEGIGGGMFNLNSHPQLNNVTIKINEAKSGGGMANWSDSNPSLTDVLIFENNAEYGGGMHNNEGNPIINGGAISSNTAKNGGGLFNSYSTPTLEDVTIYRNMAENNGGGIYNRSSDPIFNHLMVQQNEAQENGGGIFNQESNPILTGLEIVENKALNGGGIYNHQDSSPMIDGGTITGNEAFANDVSVDGRGGGIYNAGSNSEIKNLTVEDNVALRGGGIFNIENSNPLLTDVEIIGNSSTYDSGGGLYNNESSPELLRVIIKQNKAESSGGGMYNSYDSDATLTNVSISGNIALWNGGGIFNFNSSPELLNVLISGNEAKKTGGGIETRMGGSKPVLINVTITGNKAVDGGALNNAGSNPVIYNSIIWGNSHYLTNGRGTTPVISHSLIEGSGGSEAWNSNFGLDEGGNIDGDPKFVNREDSDEAPTMEGDYQLTATSPAINTGDDSHVPAGITQDLNGNDRFIDIVDMGVYEFQSTPAENEAPVIDATDKTITVGETFDPLDGVTATDAEDGDVTDQIIVAENEVDTTTPGDYEVTYEVTDSDGETVTKTITVTVEPMPAENEAPVIDATDKTITVGDTFDPLDGVTATDAEDGDVTDQIIVAENEVDTTTPGDYEVTYEVTDSDGETVTKTITVTVEPMPAENEAPVIDASDKTITVGDTFDPLDGVTATDAEDGDLTDRIVVVENDVDPSAVGIYQVTYEVTDTNEKKTTKSITVTVEPESEDDPIDEEPDGDAPIEEDPNQDELDENNGVDHDEEQLKNEERQSNQEESNTNVEDDTEEIQNEALPKTASNIYNWFVASIILIASGIILLKVYRRKYIK